MNQSIGLIDRSINRPTSQPLYTVIAMA